MTIGAKITHLGLELERDHFAGHGLNLVLRELNLVFLAQTSDDGAEPRCEFEIWFIEVGAADAIFAIGAIAVLNVE